MKRSLAIAIPLFMIASVFIPVRVLSANSFRSDHVLSAANSVSADKDVSPPLASDGLSTTLQTTERTDPHRGLGLESDPSSGNGMLPVLEACSSASPALPLEIPDDGSWVQVCYSDPHAPPKGTVTEVHAKYELEHPDPSQLEVQLIRCDSSIIQPLWNRGTPTQGTELGRARGLQAFKGVTAPGEWRLQIRDLVPGKKGQVKVVTIRVDYAPVGPLPIQKAGSPAKPGSLYMPLGTESSKTPDRNPIKPTSPTPTPKKGETKSPLTPQSRVSPATRTSWQTIKNETFEGAFPSCGGAFANACWTRSGLTTDAKEYLWDDDDWKPHTGGWAAWPAAGGANWRDPQSSTYAPYMYSWMVYGPFDLRSGTSAQVNFWLWREIENTWDKVGFFISTDGVNWTPFWWDTSNPNWEQEVIDLTPFVGNTTVWVGWLFSSDGSVEYQGPWIDDINVLVLPGEVTARGDFHFYDRGDAWTGADGMNVYLYDRNDNGSLRELQRTTSQPNGAFTFSPEMNWDTDSVDQDRRLDLLVAWETDTSTGSGPRRVVRHTNSQAYKWQSTPINNVSNGTGSADFYGWYLANDAADERAMWLFDDLRRGSEYVKSHTIPSVDPGGSIAYWELGVTGFGVCATSSCFYAGPGGPWIFIHSDQARGHDIPEHELGHEYMWTTTGGWWNWELDCALNHNVWKSVNAGCAWSEGWANFFALAVNNDANLDAENLETPTWGDGHPQGDTVEGRVAGALWDFYDNANDGNDVVSHGFAPIWSQMARNPGYDNFRAYWDGWKASGRETHLSVQAIYQNTIDYDSAPYWSPQPLAVLRDRNLTIDLWPYVWDTDSQDIQLGFPGSINLNPQCAVVLGGHMLTFTPNAGYAGTCSARVDAFDGLKTSVGTFSATVVWSRALMPQVLK